MRLVFMGTPDFSVPALDALIEAGHEILCVYTQPPRAAGRGKKTRPTPVHARALALGLDVRHPLNFKEAETRDAFAALNADLAVVVAYGLILPQAVLDAPKHGCLNIHASLLPRWRGAAPIHRAIMAGDAKTGVCIMQMDAGLDTGGVRHRRETDIGPRDTTMILHDRLSQMGADAVVEVLNDLENHPVVAQPSAGVTYAQKIDKAEAEINFARSGAEVARHIRGLSPFPGAWSLYNGARVKFLDATAEADQGEIGEVLTHDISIACGQGSITAHVLQRAGKQAMDAETFLRGFDIEIGQKFGS